MASGINIYADLLISRIRILDINKAYSSFCRLTDIWCAKRGMLFALHIVWYTLLHCASHSCPFSPENHLEYASACSVKVRYKYGTDGRTPDRYIALSARRNPACSV